MKVLLVVTNYEFAFPFIQDLEEALNNAGIETDVLDVLHFWHKRNGSKHFFAPESLKRLSQKRKIGTLVTIAAIKRYLPKIKGQYNAIGIHSCEHIYYYLVNDFKKACSNLSVMIWGSDFYRISNELREKNRKIFDTVRYIVFGNPQNANDFTSYYKQYSEKSLIAGFGIKKFKLIKNLMKSETKEELRSKMELPTDKIVISCGYNGREMQQHLLLLDELGKLSDMQIQKLFLIFQMGYGTDAAYLKQITDKLKRIGVDYKTFDKMLSDEEIAMLRLVPDITLNAQVSDGFSSSIQEHLLAQNILIVGDWLPYHFLREKGVFFKSCKAEDFHTEINDAISSLDKYKKIVASNTSIIDSISGWDVRITEWEKVYSGDVANLQYQKN